MKIASTKRKRMLSTALMALVLILAASPVSAFTIEDTGAAAFWGGRVVQGSSTSVTPWDDDYYGDVIGAEFALDAMSISFDGTVMTVTITGPYFSDGIYDYNGVFSPGDLYINPDGWIATQLNESDVHYKTDTFEADEGWKYVVTPTGVYNLNYATVVMTDVPLSGTWRYRDSQAWRGGATGASLSGNEFEYILANTGLTYTFDTSELNLDTTKGFGLHWTMRCGNDVIEGLDPAPPTETPEPGTLFLLGAGLLGTGVAVRRKFKKVA